ncbi:Spectrin beta chain [Schistosoma japonicum]|nr:Spectrin beta chain [Schistosoma japonicum]
MIKKLTDTNQTNSVDTYFDQFQIDVNQLVAWIDSVQNLLYMLDTTDNQQFNGNLPRFYLQMNLVNSLQSIQLYYSYLDKKLMEISQWNTAVESHELNSNKERERLSTVDQQTIVIDVLAEQKSFRVDKEIVINSTSRQMDHVS